MVVLDTAYLVNAEPYTGAMKKGQARAKSVTVANNMDPEITDHISVQLKSSF